MYAVSLCPISNKVVVSPCACCCCTWPCNIAWNNILQHLLYEALSISHSKIHTLNILKTLFASMPSPAQLHHSSHNIFLMKSYDLKLQRMIIWRQLPGFQDWCIYLDKYLWIYVINFGSSLLILLFCSNCQ